MPSPSEERLIHPQLAQFEKMFPQVFDAYNDSSTIKKGSIRPRLQKLDIHVRALFGEFRPPRTDYMRYLGLIPGILRLVEDWATIAGQPVSIPTLERPITPEFERKIRDKVADVDGRIRRHTKFKDNIVPWDNLKAFILQYTNANAELRIIQENIDYLPEYCAKIFEIFSDLKERYEESYIVLQQKEKDLRALLARYKFLPEDPSVVLDRMFSEESSEDLPSTPERASTAPSTRDQPAESGPTSSAEGSGIFKQINKLLHFLLVDILWGIVKKCFPFLAKKKDSASAGMDDAAPQDTQSELNLSQGREGSFTPGRNARRLSDKDPVSTSSATSSKTHRRTPLFT